MRQDSSGRRRWAGAAACSCLVLAYCLLFDYRGMGWRLAPLAAALGAAAGMWAWGLPRPRVLAVLGIVAVAAAIGVRWDAMAASRAAWVVAAVGVAALAASDPGRRALPYVVAGLAVCRLPLQFARLLPECLVGDSPVELWSQSDLGPLGIPMWGPFCSALAAMALPMVLSEARSAPSRRARVVCWVLAWLLLLTVATNPSFTALGALAVGLLWAAVWGRWLRRVGWLIVLGAILVSCALGVKLMSDRESPVRNRLLQAAGEWSADRAYVWEGASRAALHSPLVGVGLGGFGRAYGPTRPVAWLSIAGLDRPYTALCDPLLAAGELGIPVAAALSGLMVWACLRPARRDPGISGALVAGCVFGTVVGHVFAPVNCTVLLALAVAGLAHGDSRGTSDPPRAATPVPLSGAYRLLPSAYLCVAVVVCAAQFVAPDPGDGIARTQAVALWRAAAETGSRADYETAAGAFRLRWQASVSQTGEMDVARTLVVARVYSTFSREYAAVLEREGNEPESRAYRALAGQLDSWLSRSGGLLIAPRR